MSSPYADQTRLQVLSDDEGSVTLGWLARDVLYTRFSGGLSAAIGMAYAESFRELLSTVSSLSYFADSSELSYYEVLARSAFARLILESRRKFSALVMLTSSVGSAQAGQAIATAIGGPLNLLSDALEFEQCLLAVAPLAKQRLDSRLWERRSPSSSPVSSANFRSKA